MHWHDGGGIRQKLDQLIEVVEDLAEEGDSVSAIGLSAGGSAAFNLLIERPDLIQKAVSISARIHKGLQRGYRSFAERTKSSIAFAESVILFESRTAFLTEDDKRRLMTVRPQFGDQLVPADMAILAGATNITLPLAEHITTIALALTLFSRPIIDFLKGNRKTI